MEYSAGSVGGGTGNQFKIGGTAYFGVATGTTGVFLGNLPLTIQSSQNVTLIAGNNNDQGASTTPSWRYRVTGVSGSVLTGIQHGGVNGTVIVVSNVSTVAFTIDHENANSTASYRFRTHNAAALTLPPYCGVVFQWSSTTSRWEQVSDVTADYTLTSAAVEAVGSWSLLTDPATPALVFTSGGDVISVWVPA